MKYNWSDIKSRVNSTNNANKDLHSNFLMQIIEQSFNGSFPEWFNAKNNISEDAFYNNKKITNITIPNNVKKIGAYAFYECSNLEEAILPDGLTDIDTRAFKNSGLKSITIPDSIKYIGSEAFSSCSSLENIILPDCYFEHEYSSYQGSKCLENITTGTKYIGNHFIYDSASPGLTIKEGTLSIAKGAISRYTSKISFPSSLKKIPPQCCKDNSNLSIIEMGEGIETIGREAFRSCSNLSSVTFPNTIKKIDSYAFSYCKKLINVTLPNSIKQIDEDAFSSSGLTSIIIPNSVEYIGSSAFSKCTSLETATINGNIETLDIHMFSHDTSLRIVKIKNIKKISSYAFYNCSSLTDVFIYSSIPPEVEYQAFGSTNSTFKIHVPIGTKKSYTASPFWNDLGSSRYVEDITL